MTISRRQFLNQSILAGLATSTMTVPFVGMPQVLAANPLAKVSSDYKAMVCIFLFGGNDGFNMFIPNDMTGYSTYANSRQNLAIAQADLLPVNPSSGGDYGFHPAMAEIQQLFESGQVAVQANVGPLIQPVTKDLIYDQSVLIPPQLFSHNDQQALWQTGYASDFINQGWGGRVADQVSQLNSATIPMNISISGNNLFQVGDTVAPYAMNSEGPSQLLGVNPDLTPDQFRSAAFQRIRDLGTNHILETAHKDLTRSTQDVAQILSEALLTAPELNTVFPQGNGLAAQLSLVAKMIAISESLGFERQIFFVGMGGFDTHDRQVEDQPGLLSTVSQAMSAFYQSTVELGVADQVTSFTLSDFGRTLTSNGDGTDHGWGSHHLMMGGAVNGGDVYGVMPELSIGGPDDVDDGRMIPTTSVDQYSATISRWFGLSESQLNDIFPNLTNFNSNDLGFMRVDS